MESVRAFLALELNDEARAVLAQLLKEFRQTSTRASWVRPENLHLTLHFLGDIVLTDFDSAFRELELSVAQIDSFVTTLQGVEAAPNVRRPRLVWACVPGAPDALTELSRVVRSLTNGLIAQPDTRPFTPHVTLGRIRDPRSAGPVLDIVNRNHAVRIGEFAVTRVALFRSTLARDGARYELLRDFPLRWTSSSERPTA